MTDISNLFNQHKGRFDADMDIRHHFSDGLYARQMTIPKGFTAISHKHSYDHLSILAVGKCLVKTDDDEQTYEAPACITIKAGTNHAILALEDVSWFCIHATDVTEEHELDEVLIEKEGVK